MTAIFPINKNDSWPAPMRAGFAALSARDRLSVYNCRAARLGLEEISMQTGLSHGQVIIGHIGNRAKSDFSVIGPVLTAARKAAELCGRANAFMPVTDQNFMTAARDYLLFKPFQNEKAGGSDDNAADHFNICGFANLAYFCERLKSGSSERALISVIQAFGLTGTAEGFGFLKKFIEDPDCSYRREAVKALSPFMALQNADIKEYLRNLVINSKEPEIRSTAISILGLARDQQTGSFFASLFTDSDDRVRANAVEAFITLDIPDKSEHLKKLVYDSAPRVCANALLGLWLADDQQTLSCLYDLLKSDNSGKRSSAAFAVYFLAAARKFRRLFPGYSEQPGLVTLSIIENIFLRLKQMLESEENSERYQALRAIGRVADIECRELITSLLQDETDPEIINLAHSILSDWEKKAGTQSELPRERFNA
ncbi:MAG: HEAT repeat domain-containing protein [Candidatus Riflebacteria bacterium]|nr:HEAT repeat domain-containing protein [Candidatus Riflebacteria bacterium]